MSADRRLVFSRLSAERHRQQRTVNGTDRCQPMFFSASKTPHEFDTSNRRSRCHFVFQITMSDEHELLDYDEPDETPQEQQSANKTRPVINGSAAGKTGEPPRGTYVSIHASGFKDFLLKPELLRAIMDCGFEHPSEGIFALAMCIVTSGIVSFTSSST
jgi:hypothetical protein